MLAISEFKKLYEEIKSGSYCTEDKIIDSLKNNFIDFYCNRFRDTSSIFSKFDWYAVCKV